MSQTPDQFFQTEIQAVYSKAAKDPVFRKLCVSNPNAAIKEATGTKVPDGLKIKIVDGDDAHLTFVLPRSGSTSGELRDEDLEQVSGGAQKDPLFMHKGETWTKGNPGGPGDKGDKGDQGDQGDQGDS
jgi:hypothetical protein